LLSNVGDQRADRQAVDQRRNSNGVEAVPWQQHEAHEIAERVGQGQDLGRHAAFGAADSLARSPPLWNGPPLSCNLIGQPER
jgi:hypothetical protein